MYEDDLTHVYDLFLVSISAHYGLVDVRHILSRNRFLLFSQFFAVNVSCFLLDQALLTESNKAISASIAQRTESDDHAFKRIDETVMLGSRHRLST